MDGCPALSTIHLGFAVQLSIDEFSAVVASLDRQRHLPILIRLPALTGPTFLVISSALKSDSRMQRRLYQFTGIELPFRIEVVRTSDG